MPLKQSEGLLSGYRAAKEQEALKKKHGINSSNRKEKRGGSNMA